MKSVFYILLILTCTVSCGVKDAEDDKIANLIFHAENNEDSILLNLSISYRERFPSEESKPLYFIHHDSTGKTVVNPHTFKQTLGYFLENNTFYQVEMFMKTRYGITSEIETNFEEKSNQILRYNPLCGLKFVKKVVHIPEIQYHM